MTTYSDNHPCSGCPKLRRCINGFYCTFLRTYVHVAKQRPCQSQL